MPNYPKKFLFSLLILMMPYVSSASKAMDTEDYDGSATSTREVCFVTENNDSDSKEDHSLAIRLKQEALLHKFTHGDIIYVYGTSTAGKTTFTKVLSRYSGYALLSTRDLKASYMTKIIKEIFPKEYEYLLKNISNNTIIAFLSNSIDSIPETLLTNRPTAKVEHSPPAPNDDTIINLSRFNAARAQEAERHHDLANYNYHLAFGEQTDNDFISKSNKKLIKVTTTLESIKDKSALIEKRYHPIEQLHYMYDYVFRLSKKKINVILDNLDVSEFLNYISLNNIHCPLHLLLMYCPPDLILERVIKRNELAIKKDIMDKRSLMRPLEGFIDIYTYSTNENFIDEIEKKNFIDVFNLAYNKSRDEKDSHPLSQSSWKNMEEILSNSFGLYSTIKLKSKYPYDILLDTSKSTPEQLASKVYTYIGIQKCIGKPQCKQNYFLDNR